MHYQGPAEQYFIKNQSEQKLQGLHKDALDHKPVKRSGKLVQKFKLNSLVKAFSRKKKIN